MTIQEIEQKIGGHYNKAANQEKIIKMWELIGNNYTIYKQDTLIRIFIPDTIYDIIRRQIGYNMVHLTIYTDTKQRIFVSRDSELERYMKVQTTKTQKASITKKTKPKESSKQPNKNSPYGIYCIQYRGEIIYIGMTQTSFEQRWKEHLQLFKHPNNSDMLLYHANVDPNELEFRVMVDLTKEKANRELTTRDIKAMEMGFIACFKPRFNVSGVKIPYRFD